MKDCQSDLAGFIERENSEMLFSGLQNEFYPGYFTKLSSIHRNFSIEASSTASKMALL